MSHAGQGTFRYQGQPSTHPYTFAQVGISTKDAEAAIKVCYQVPHAKNLFVSGSHPVSKSFRLEDTTLNAVYASQHVLGGISCQDVLGRQATTCFLGVGDPTLKAAVESSFSSEGSRDPSWSWGLTYSSSAYKGINNFISTSLRVRNFEALDLAVYQRMIVKRRVKNPFESDRVIGICNVIDAGVSVVTPIGDAKVDQSMKMGMQWQVNKNVTVKGSVSLESVAAGVALKSWWDPTVTLAANLSANYKTGETGMGLAIKVENVGKVLYSRADKSSSFAVQTQESQASAPEMAMGSETRPGYKEDDEQSPEGSAAQEETFGAFDDLL